MALICIAEAYVACGIYANAVQGKKKKMLELFLRTAKKVAKEKRAKHAIHEI